ncbi:hypothetical protein ABE41_016690 [Fictibacillus arsenicus]|uniref:Uncharacterized protein n=1 Tax=Fictibacillus arsenicus TaxID=255247 RepID=A0A1B1Z890_9BACL|nr:hypothetical protein [Fictibacillus arsenicus]ANX13650.1 hypothetical protein ABE41_016690 [Fictibacillus arsenicus]
MNTVNKGTIWLLSLISLITIALTFVELSQPYESPEDAQSRFEMHIKPLYTLCLIGTTAALFYFKNKLRSFDGPVFIFLGGLWYLWVFMTFTVGWVMIQGFIGFFLSLIVSLILTLYQWIMNVKNQKNHTS